MNKDSFWIQIIVFILLGTAAIAGLNPKEVNNPTKPAESLVSPTNSNYITPSKTLKINLSVSSLSDLKVKEGSQISKGQIIADNDRDRKRLTLERQSILLARAKIEQTPAPVLKAKKVLQDLPSISYSEEESAINQAELKFTQAQRNYANALANDPFINARANVDFAKANVEQAYRAVELQQKKLEAVSGIKGLPPEILTHETEKFKQIRSEWEKAQAMYQLKEAEYNQGKEERENLLLSLQNAVEQAKAELELSQSKLRSAKETRNRLEYEYNLEIAKRDEEANKQEISLSQQKLDREFKLSQLNQDLNAVDEKLNSIAVVRSPYNGTIKKIKVEGQQGNNINIVVYLSF